MRGRGDVAPPAPAQPMPVTAAPVPPPAAPVPPPPAVAGPAAPTVIPRSAWTRDPVGGNADPLGPVRRITLHHTGEHLSSSGITDVELIRRIERHHRVNLGWAAIGYHYLIGRDGTIYEGRPLRWQGAHCGGDANRNNLGITMIGEYDHVLPPARQLAALERLLDAERARHRIPARELYGHRDWKGTICPGERLAGWLADYRRRKA